MAHGQLQRVADGRVEVNEFDFQDDNGVCYDKDGVVIRHCRRAHGKDGASGYRLDWNGLSFVWTGDGRPDANTVKFSKGVDVFVTEIQPDLANLQSLKFGLPAIIATTTIDGDHTPHYATGYCPAGPAAPRHGDPPGLRQRARPGNGGRHPHALQWPVPVRRARRRGGQCDQEGHLYPQGGAAGVANLKQPSGKDAIELFGLSLTYTTVDFPNPKHASLTEIEGPVPRNVEYDAKLYYPPDVYRKPDFVWPQNFKIDVGRKICEKVVSKIRGIFGGDE